MSNEGESQTEPAPEAVPEIMLLPKQEPTVAEAIPTKRLSQGTVQPQHEQFSAQQNSGLPQGRAGDAEKGHALSVAASVAASLAFVFFVVMVYAAAGHQPLRGRPNCDSDDCMKHAFLLSATLNHSIDPCEDFAAFACSAWLTSTVNSRSVQDDLWYRWTKRMAERLGAQRPFPDSRAIAKAASQLQRCLDVVQPDGENLRAFREFLEERKLSGNAPAEGVHALDVLLDLAINWQMPIWFAVSVVTSRNNESIGVLIDYGRYYPHWVDPAPPQVQEGGDAEEAAMDRSILTAFRHLSDIRRHYSPRVIPISDIANMTSRWTSELWLEFLNKHLSPAFKVRSDDYILLADFELLEQVGGFVARYTDFRLLGHFYRILNKTFSNLATNSTQEIYEPADDYSPLPLQNQTLMCQLQVEDTFKSALAASHVAESKLLARRAAIDEIFANVVRTATELLSRTEWMSERTKNRTIRKITTASIKLWPDDKLMNEESVSRLYSAFRSTSSVYARDMIQSRRRMRLLLGTVSYGYMTVAPHGGRRPYISYNPFDNSFTVAVGALSEPLYYPEGTTTLNYAGLGSALATSLLNAIDSEDVDTGSGGWVLSKRRPMYQEAPCMDATSTNFYPASPSLQITHQAYLTALQKEGKSSDVRLESMEKYSAEQVFFLSFCHRTCHYNVGFKTSDECNSAVRNFEPFARAFRCSLRSAMNPDSKCSFLS